MMETKTTTTTTTTGMVNARRQTGLRGALLFLANLIPVPWRVRSGWQWYRRLHGGRWSRSATTVGRWFRQSECPGPFNSYILGGEPVPSGACFDQRNEQLYLEDADGNPLPRAEDAPHECHCEVWP